MQDERDAEQAKQWHDRLCIDHQEVIMKAVTRELDGDIYSAQDICQKALFTAWTIALRQPSMVPAKENERVWLFTITRNHLRNHRRQAKRHRHLPYDPDTMGRLHVEESADAGLFTESIDPAGRLANLSREDRVILDLKHVDGLTSEEIAKLLGIKPAAARQRLHRAQLRAAKLLLASPSGPSTQVLP